MANSFCDALEAAVLNHFFKAGSHAAVSQPTNLYVALFTADPTDTGDLTNEVSGGSYARQLVTFDATTTSGTNTRTKNSSQLTFPTATGAWGTVTHFGVIDTASGAATLGMFVHDALTASKVVGTGDVFQVAAAALTIDLD